MKELHEAIVNHGIGMHGGILRVDMFLNHRVDTELLTRMGQAFYHAFQSKPIDLIVTAESGGIPIALTTAQAFGNLPVVIAKKGFSANMVGDVFQTHLKSYTRGMETTICVSKAYLPKGSRVLIIDDFLANGEAAHGLIELAGQAGAIIQGIGVCIEKAFEPGGAALRSAGFAVVALASVAGFRDGKPVLVEER